MSQENIETLHQVYRLMNTRFAALKAGDFDPLLEFFDPDAVIEVSDAPDPRIVHDRIYLDHAQALEAVGLSDTSHPPAG
jgi:ketosteroid isomerase-like protein